MPEPFKTLRPPLSDGCAAHARRQNGCLRLHTICCRMEAVLISAVRATIIVTSIFEHSAPATKPLERTVLLPLAPHRLRLHFAAMRNRQRAK